MPVYDDDSERQAAAFAETGCGASSTTIVLTVEVVKIAMALLLFALESGGVAPACAELARVTRAEPAECGKIAVPALVGAGNG